MIDPASQNPASNLDPETVTGFGAEWSRFDYRSISDEEVREAFDVYFQHVDPALLSGDVLDVGCGSGRWARIVAETATRLTLVDASSAAVEVARRALNQFDNCEVHVASVDTLPVEDGSQDLVYSLGVLHHIPDPEAGLRACARAVRPGGSLLVYLYYRFDNRPAWFRRLWAISDVMRRVLSRQPFVVRRFVADFIAITIYWPLSRMSSLVQSRGVSVDNFPLSAYSGRSLYWLRTDALDRFGTRLEHRFTRVEIEAMLERAGLIDPCFVEDAAFWTVVARKPD